MTVRESRALATLARRQLHYKAAQARAEAAKRRRDRSLDACEALLPAGDWVSAGPFLLRLRRSSTGERFRLADYRKAGGRVTRAMGRFITAAGTRRELDVRHDQEPPTP